MIRKLLTYTLGLPLLVLPSVLNYLLQDFADSLHYSRDDMYRYPVVYTLLGWMMVLVMGCFVSPLLLLVDSLGSYGTLLTSVIVFGMLLWLITLAYALTSVKWIVKKLTVLLLSLWKSLIGLRSQKLTADETTDPSRAVHLYHPQHG